MTASRSGSGALSSVRMGRWSALASFILGIAYVAAVVAGTIAAGAPAASNRPIEDPFLAVMELLTMLGALLLIVVMAAVREYASPEHRAPALIAFSFAVLLAGVSSSVHFVQLTAVLQGAPGALTWPSAAMALDWFAWDVFLGLSMLFAAPVFSGPGLERGARTLMRVTGVLCLVGVSGPATGRLPLQLIGVAGYGLVLTTDCLIIAILMHRRAQQPAEAHLLGEPCSGPESVFPLVCPAPLADAGSLVEGGGSDAGAPAALPTCAWPAIDQGDASPGQCRANRTLLACVLEDGSNEICASGNPTSCPDQSPATTDSCIVRCAADEYAVACGSPDPAAPAFVPPAGLACHALAYTPGGVVFYCCPCP